uniref:Uncharacterized protein n=1 Tax=Sinocyclocheilus anshuiensis TaxID=1608454 RepID=A0A671KIU8_9TELE
MHVLYYIFYLILIFEIHYKCSFNTASMVLDAKNTLICHVTELFPSLYKSKYHPKRDSTFNIISTLKFSPEEGDICCCTVYHTALQSKTKRWVRHLVDDVLSVCGVSLTLGLLVLSSSLKKTTASNRSEIQTFSYNKKKTFGIFPNVGIDGMFACVYKQFLYFNICFTFLLTFLIFIIVNQIQLLLCATNFLMCKYLY